MARTPKTKKQSKIEKYIVVSSCKLSNFPSNYSDKIKFYVEQLSGTYKQQLRNYTDILIAGSINCQGFKIAKLLKKNVVTLQWLLDSYEIKKFVSPEKYQIKSKFLGLRIGCYEIEQSVSNIMRKQIQKNEGDFIDYKQNISKQEIKKLDILVISKKSKQKFMDYLKIDTNIVFIQWFNQCIKRNHYVFAEDYAINKPLNYTKIMHKIIAKAKKIQNQRSLAKQNLFGKQQILSNCCLYFANFASSQLNSLILITNYLGGFYYKQFSKLVTHVVSKNLNSNYFEKYKRYGNSCKIVRIDWLFHCLKFQIKCYEIDYQIKLDINQMEKKHSLMLKKQIDYTLSQQNIQKKNSFRSRASIQTTNSNSQFHRLNSLFSLTSQSQQQSISHKKKEYRLSIINPEKTISNLFKGVKFFFPQEQKSSLKQVKKLILNNAGGYITDISKGHFFFVLDDSQQNPIIIEKYKHITHVEFISKRWIKYCLFKKIVIKDFQTHKMLDLLPLNFHIPIKKMQNYTIEVLGFNEYQTYRIKRMLSDLGSKSNQQQYKKITHIVCKQPQYLRQKKFEWILQQNKNIILVSIQWFFHILKKGEPNNQLFRINKQ